MWGHGSLRRRYLPMTSRGRVRKRHTLIMGTPTASLLCLTGFLVRPSSLFLSLSAGYGLGVRGTRMGDATRLTHFCFSVLPVSVRSFSTYFLNDRRAIERWTQGIAGGGVEQRMVQSAIFLEPAPKMTAISEITSSYLWRAGRDFLPASNSPHSPEMLLRLVLQRWCFILRNRQPSWQ